tara:strand:- start:247 stop:1188 length:942 start_codon:yes stop_codon:yes gene_type:complete
MPSPLLKWINGLITIAIAIISFYLFYQHREDFYLISKLNPNLFFTLSFLSILSIIINGNKLRHITESFNIKLNFNEWVGLAFISSSLNGVVYKSGSLITSNYLKRQHYFPYTSFIGSLGADHLMLILINACIALGISIYSITLSEKIFPLTLVFLGIVITVLYLAKSPFRFSKSENRFFKTLLQAARILNNILQNKLLFRKLVLNNLFLVIVMGLRFYFACKAIGINIDILNCYIFTTVSAFVRLIPMLQSDIGSRELAVGFLSQSFGSGFKQGVLATAVDRVFEMVWALLGMAIFKNLLFSANPNTNKENFN